MEKLETGFNNISINMLGYFLQFFETNEILNYAKINKKFHKATNSEVLWENVTLRDDLFAQQNKENEQKSWKRYCLNNLKLKSNFKNGRPNASFKMKPMRGHKNFITAISYIDKQGFNTVISGDISGDVFYWVVDEEGDYQSKTIIQTASEIIQIDIKETLCLEAQNTIDLIIISCKNGRIFVFKFENFKFEISCKIQSDIADIYQVEVENNSIFLSSNFHNHYSAKSSNFIESWNILKGNLEGKYIPNYTFNSLKKATEEAAKFKTKFVCRSYFNFSEINERKKSFMLKGNKIYLLLNFDIEEQFLVSKYKTVYLENLFVFNKNNPFQNEKFIIDLCYLIEITSINNYIVIVGMDSLNKLNILFFDMTMKLKMKHTLEIDGFNQNNSIFQNIPITEERLLINTRMLTKNPYHYSKIKEEGLVIIINNYKFTEILITQNNKLAIKNSKDIELKSKKINSMICDSFKFAIAFDDNTIKIFSSKDKTLWYNLLGGSLTIIPKSFINHPNIQGFFKVILTKYSIIGVVGNLIRQYYYNHNLK